MDRASRIALFVSSLLVSSWAIADDTTYLALELYASGLTRYSLPVAAHETDYAIQTESPYAAVTAHYRIDELPPITSVAFRDMSAIARASKVRELSLLTLAEVGKTRLFFGVNTEGLFGIHLRALPRPGDEHCVEFARMPYLKNTATYSDAH